MSELAEYMRGFDLVLTCNWGAMDAVMAHRLARIDLSPIIHHEGGFNTDKVDGLKTSRTLLSPVRVSDIARACSIFESSGRHCPSGLETS